MDEQLSSKQAAGQGEPVAEGFAIPEENERARAEFGRQMQEFLGLEPEGLDLYPVTVEEELDGAGLPAWIYALAWFLVGEG
jgi:hypothetical protein